MGQETRACLGPASTTRLMWPLAFDPHPNMTRLPPCQRQGSCGCLCGRGSGHTHTLPAYSARRLPGELWAAQCLVGERLAGQGGIMRR